jgi:hypothetical protein
MSEKVGQQNVSREEIDFAVDLLYKAAVYTQV